MTATTADAAKIDRNKLLVSSLYDSLMAGGDVGAAERLLSDTFADHDIPGLGSGGADELVAAVLQVRSAFPDISPQLFEIVGEGDWVAVRVEAAGTHTGEPFAGIPATGKPMRWKEMHLFRCVDGRIVEHRGVFDMLSILQQLGAIAA